MRQRIKNNFRGYRAFLVGLDDASAAQLRVILTRLGLVVEIADLKALSAQPSSTRAVVFFDADEEPETHRTPQNCGGLASIAVIGNEAPSRLARVVSCGCDSHIVKPIRSTGVFTALVLAVNGRDRVLREQAETQALQQRLAGRRVVTKAIVALVQQMNLDDEQAYEYLRKEAMDRRISIEQMAKEYLMTSGAAPDSWASQEG